MSDVPFARAGEGVLVQLPAKELDELRNVKHALDEAAIVAVTDRRGTILEVNNKFCEISRYARHELIGQDHRIVNSGHHSKAFMTAMWQRIASGQTWRGELLNRAKDGSGYWVDTTIVPFLDARGEPYQFLAIHYDITDRKRAEAQLREQAVLAQIGEMAAIVAHEVKNPLAGIGGALQMIERQMPGDASVRPVIGQIHRRLDAVNRMVEDLLLFARPAPARRTPIRATAVVARAKTLFAQHPRRGCTEVDVDVAAAGGLHVRADLELLAIALAQMLINAAQAMQGIGRIGLRVEAAADRSSCAFVVSDEGPGIPADLKARLPRIFHTTKTQGLGLGLSIAHRVAEQHDGRLTIQSEEGRGTVVTLSLPLPLPRT
jgi:PAS domain S-box-containing protein